MRKEQNCIFIDSKGLHQKFCLHLPLDLEHLLDCRQASDVKSWPLLLYLHGSGGGSFFTHGKKHINSVGLHFVAERFVVLSPICNWNWKEEPKPWVMELLNSFRAAHWVDNDRIYLTGCSMGGMSTWEVAAGAPDVFAAIAPVAAHHKKDRTQHIGRQLHNVPVLAIASMNDETCPISAEEQLWKHLVDCGNQKLSVGVARNVDHCSMNRTAYCDDTVLYRWLLKNRKTQVSKSHSA